MEKRDFLIQRYCSGNWPAVKGEVPFITTGPNFKAYTTTQAINYEWKFRQMFLDEISAVKDDGIAREVIAELFLREGIVQALWSVNTETCLPEELRWEISVKRLADEIPSGSLSLTSAVIQLLSGMSDPSFYRSYLSEDSLELQPVRPPAE